MNVTQFCLDNLTLIVDHNRLQQGARLADTNDIAPIKRVFDLYRLSHRV